MHVNILLSVIGLLIQCLPLLIGTIIAFSGNAYSFDIDTDKMYEEGCLTVQ